MRVLEALRLELDSRRRTVGNLHGAFACQTNLTILLMRNRALHIEQVAFLWLGAPTVY
jgi:hypothetical protein